MQVTEILKQCTVDGLIIKLPSGQLDRNDYLEVKKALELIGGSWKGCKTQGFVFKEDPTDYLEQLCNGEKINLKKEFQFFATPDTLADRLVELAEIQPEYTILEPSAGQGAIANAIYRLFPEITVDCFELMDLNRTFLEKLPNVNIIGSDFIAESKPNLYDCIIANPPFSKNQDIDHVYEMYRCLKPGGRMVSIMSNHWRNSSANKECNFSDWLGSLMALIYDIEEGAFKESGTAISACIVVIDWKNDCVIPEKNIQSAAKPTNKVIRHENSSKEIAPNHDFYGPENYRDPDEILDGLIALQVDISNSLQSLKNLLQESFIPEVNEAASIFEEIKESKYSPEPIPAPIKSNQIKSYQQLQLF